MNENEDTYDSDAYAFCADCGKILITDHSGTRCTKCGERLPSKQDSTMLVKEEKIQIKKQPSKGNWEDYFPYLKIKPLQREIIESIFTKIKDKPHFIIQAANGVGKTIAVLTALLLESKNKKKTIVYSCRTHQQMSRVISELKLVQQLKPVTGIALRGRKEICLHPIVQKFAVDAGNASDICRYLKEGGKCKYFNRLANKKVQIKLEEITKKQVIDGQELLEIGKSLEVCPFEITYDLLPKADVVACSYQYVFNPNIQTTFFNSLEKELKDIILIVDEAHNLPSTAIDVSSSTLSSYTIDSAEKEAIKYKMGEIYDTLEALSHVLNIETKNLRTDEEKRIEATKFLAIVEKRARNKIDEEMIKIFNRMGELVKKNLIQQNKAPFSYISSVTRSLALLFNTKTRDDYAHFITKVQSRGGNPIPKLIVLSLDARNITKDIFDKVYASVSLSGTLEPINAYSEIIGLEKNKVMSLDLPSPYKKENHLTIVVDKVSSKLEDRIPANYLKMVDVIATVIENTPKNVGVFCASYTVMDGLLKHGLENKIEKPVYIAQRGMSSFDTDDLVNNFKTEAKNSGGVLISVLGGRSSEGSDYPAEEMQSVIIIGIPYAKPSPSLDATIKYLDGQFPTKGREYGYNIPALTRASQAAGRPIRSLEDFGVIVLLDYRFARFYYKKHLPNWLKQNVVVVQPEEEDLENKMQGFYDYHK
jgi:DNA excision repair protein ERCC-2